MNPITVREDWETYEARMLPPGYGAARRQELRQAFDAGAFAMLMKIRAEVTKLTPDDEGISALENRLRECSVEFYHQISEGRS
jgi:hypothetical protein